MKKRYLLIVALLIILLGLAGYFYYAHHFKTTNGGGSQSYRPATPNGSKTPQPQSGGITALKHIFVIVLENHTYSDIIGSSATPYINSLANRYALANNYQAVLHPSLPNYLALTSGSNNGITSDCNPPSAGCILNVKSIADEIESSGRTWKEYAESMPSPCYMYNSGEYATKHNPFVYYRDIVDNPTRCNAHVVPFSGLNSDLGSIKTTPNFAFITPNLCNDMHDCSIATGDSWLSANVPRILNSEAFTKEPSALFIVWDEGTEADNHVVAIITGSSVKSGYVSNSSYTHYSLLHTVEAAWGLKPLTSNDANAPVLSEFFN